MNPPLFFLQKMDDSYFLYFKYLVPLSCQKSDCLEVQQRKQSTWSATGLASVPPSSPGDWCFLVRRAPLRFCLVRNKDIFFTMNTLMLLFCYKQGQNFDKSEINLAQNFGSITGGRNWKGTKMNILYFTWKENTVVCAATTTPSSTSYLTTLKYYIYRV